MGIKVLVVDDHKMVCEVLCSLLAREEDMEAVAMTDNGREAICLAREAKPDVIVMDLSMPGMDSLESCRCIMADAPESRIIVLSMHADREFVVEAFKAGAKGFIQKTGAFKTLLVAIRSIHENNGFLDPKITGIIMKDYIEHLNEPGAPDEQTSLSSRKMEVLQLIADGKNTKEVAFTLDISPKTVEAHRRKILKKLKLSNVAELTKYAIREGIIYL
jgi:DNA-binding NarL/FixJ family response regulator